MFISSGGNKEVLHSEVAIAMLGAVASGIKVLRLIDRDEMTTAARDDKINEGVRVLSRREIENYLYDPEVLRTFFREKEQEEYCDELLDRFEERLSDKDLKPVIADLFRSISQESSIQYLGSNYEEFAVQYLAPALKRTPAVYRELRDDVFS